MMRPDSNPPTPTTVCGQCGLHEPTFLHHVRHRGNFRRLCTTCVLRLHPQCFCPACLGVYPSTPPIDAVVCFKCYSSSHSTCVPAPISSTSRSPCPSCSNPELLVLNVERLGGNNGRGLRAIDGPAARLLYAAGKIAAMSMSKAEVAAATEAERRAKEAAHTKKRAKEALDHVVTLMKREKRNVGVVNNNNVVGPGVEYNRRVGVVGRSGEVVVSDGGVGVGVGVRPVVEVDRSDEVLEALNAVGLKENGAGVMDVDVVDGKESGVVSVVKNVGNGEEQVMVENSVGENAKK